jgi:hypothetical protein
MLPYLGEEGTFFYEKKMSSLQRIGKKLLCVKNQKIVGSSSPPLNLYYFLCLARTSSHGLCITENQTIKGFSQCLVSEFYLWIYHLMRR